MSQWINVATTDSIPLREGRCAKFGNKEIAIFHLADRFLAIENLCPHNQGPLCDGIVKGATVVCPLHGWNISLETGAVLKPDVPVSVRTYPVRVKDGLIQIELTQSEELAA